MYRNAAIHIFNGCFARYVCSTISCRIGTYIKNTRSKKNQIYTCYHICRSTCDIQSYNDRLSLNHIQIHDIYLLSDFLSYDCAVNEECLFDIFCHTFFFFFFSSILSRIMFLKDCYVCWLYMAHMLASGSSIMLFTIKIC
jgi:hypothetical protein